MGLPNYIGIRAIVFAHSILRTPRSSNSRHEFFMECKYSSLVFGVNFLSPPGVGRADLLLGVTIGLTTALSPTDVVHKIPLPNIVVYHVGQGFKAKPAVA